MTSWCYGFTHFSICSLSSHSPSIPIFLCVYMCHNHILFEEEKNSNLVLVFSVPANFFFLKLTDSNFLVK